MKFQDMVIQSVINIPKAFRQDVNNFYIWHLPIFNGEAPEPVILPGKQQQVAVMGQPTDQYGGHLLVIKNIYPAGEFQIRAEEDYFFALNFWKVIKEKLGTVTVVRDISELILY